MALVDYFLKIEGIDGESYDEKHKGEIDIQSFSWGEQQGGTGHSGGGHGGGKVSMQDMHFVAGFGKQSVKLFLACANGEHIKKAVLIARKAGGKQEEYLKYTLTDILVTSYQTGGSAHGGIVPTDQVSLNFAEIVMEYKPQKADGSLGAATPAGYNVKTNKKL